MKILTCNEYVFFIQTLQSLPGGGLGSKGDLRTAIKTLQACSISPGKK